MTAGNLVDVEQLTNDVQSGHQPEYQWTFENGRRYASSELGHYYMPNDEPEIQRLNEQHWILTQVKGGSLHFAPLPTAKQRARILDMGCGSGIWCVEMAEEHPQAMIVGMDVSPIQPKQKPANVEWITQDMEAAWPFPEDYFDLIRLSLVHGCVEDWAALMARLVRHLSPGGWLEHQEFSLCRQYMVDAEGQPIRMPDDVDELLPFFRWGRLMERAALKRGRPLQLGPHLATFQRDAGLHHVDEQVFAHKWGTWMVDPKERALGARTMRSTLSGMEGFTTALFTKALGWSLGDTQAFVQDVKRNMRDDSLRKVMDLHVVCGQRPGGDDTANLKKGVPGSASGSYLSLGTGVLLGAATASLAAFWLIRRR